MATKDPYFNIKKDLAERYDKEFKSITILREIMLDECKCEDCKCKDKKRDKDNPIK
jgi:hypothetical protein